MRRGVSLFGIAVLLAALTAAAARGAGSSGTTTTTSAPAYAPLASGALPRACVGAGAVAIQEPGQTLALGAPASALGPSGYHGTNAVVAFDSSSASGTTCRSESVTLDGVSLFGGAVTATSIQATNGKGTVTGLAVDGTPVSSNGQAVAIGDWGLLQLGGLAGRLSSPLALQLLKTHASLPAGTTLFLAFAASRQPAVVKKQKATTTTAKTTTQPTQTTTTRHAAHRAGKRHHAKKSRNHVAQPLKWTPRLGLSSKDYVFPVDTGASYIDTYGANRNDIYDGWHHGDDLFAPLGTPVVAVASGKLSLVGWNSLGGWRLWITDAKGNSFYYAHLSGYARWILHAHHVRAGQVVGFLGRTGDAFTTTPHLHFEIHPHQLLRLGYDGAVDPTTYLHAWRVEKLRANAIPQAARLRAPSGAPTQEAAIVWAELLRARHLMGNGLPAVAFSGTLRRELPSSQETTPADEPRRIAAIRTAAQVDPAAAVRQPWAMVVLGLTLAVSLLGTVIGVRRRTSRPTRAPLH